MCQTTWPVIITGHVVWQCDGFGDLERSFQTLWGPMSQK